MNKRHTGCWSIFWSFCQSLQDGLFYSLGKRRIILPWGSRLFLYLLNERAIRCVTPKRYKARKYMVGCHGEAIAITGRLGLALHLLWSHIFWSTGAGVRSAPLCCTRQQFGNAKVC